MTAAADFEDFISDYQDMVYTLAARLLGDRAEAQDMAQDAFLKAYQNFESIKDSPTKGGWLKAVTTNLCLNHLSRHRARWKLFSEIAEDDGAIEALAGPEKSAPDPEDAGLLERALQALPDHQRVPLVLFHFEDLSYEEIAAKLGATLAKVKTDIFRGREALRKILETGT
ncbi:MAG: RNA polymerase sigma factor [Elusimicrobia bacterium]|nr:RNA polymerase sigma factor [Elusimicrobiota bacterium]